MVHLKNWKWGICRMAFDCWLIAVILTERVIYGVSAVFNTLKKKSPQSSYKSKMHFTVKQKTSLAYQVSIKDEESNCQVGLRGWEYWWAMQRVPQGATRPVSPGCSPRSRQGSDLSLLSVLTQFLWNTHRYILTAIKISELLKSTYVSEIFQQVRARPSALRFFQCTAASPVPSLHREHPPGITRLGHPRPRSTSSYWFWTRRSCHLLLFKFFTAWCLLISARFFTVYHICQEGLPYILLKMLMSTV